MLQLRDKDRSILESILARWPKIESARVFGSRATGEARTGSDLDLAITAPEMSQADWSRFLDELHESQLIYEVDALRLETLEDEALQSAITRHGIAIYPGRDA